MLEYIKYRLYETVFELGVGLVILLVFFLTIYIRTRNNKSRRNKK